MSTAGSVTQWLAQLKVGDQSAAHAAIWDRYFQRLAALARRKLRRGPQRVADEEDVVLSALDSFFRGARQGRFPLLSDRTSLWPLLVRITARKACNQLKHAQAARRGGGHVRDESTLARGSRLDLRNLECIADDAPTAEFAAQVSEECQRRLEALEEDSLRRLALMRLAGYTNAEIAQEFGVVERTVERKLDRIRKLWGESDAT